MLIRLTLAESYSVTESTKAYAKDVLQAATQHLLNIADLVDGTIADLSEATDELDTSCQVALQVQSLQIMGKQVLYELTFQLFCRVFMQLKQRQAYITCQLCKLQSTCTDIQKLLVQLVSVKRLFPVRMARWLVCVTKLQLYEVLCLCFACSF